MMLFVRGSSPTKARSGSEKEAGILPKHNLKAWTSCQVTCFVALNLYLGRERYHYGGLRCRA
jgi:hypothetical protein